MITGFTGAGSLGALLALYEASSLPFNIALLAVSAASVGASASVFLKANKARTVLRGAWTGFYAGRRFVAPSGELVKCVASAETGDRVTVVYNNGDQAEIPLGLLKDEEAAPVVAASILTEDQKLYRRMAKVKWRTPGGQIGVVRDARYRYEADAELTLCLENGTVKEFKLPDLEPVAG